MFLIYLSILLLFVYLVPGISLFPQFVFHPRLFALIPMISAGAVFCLVTLLQALGIYHHDMIVLTSMILMGLAGIRVYFVRKSSRSYWSKQSVLIYFFHGILLLPFFVKLATHSFDRGDEIYSWNFWAIQHYLSLPIDFSHTEAAYPQLLPKLLSYCYQLLGSVDLQLPVKGLLILFSYSMLVQIGLCSALRNSRRILFYGVGLLAVLFLCDLNRFLDDGYADPLMSCGLILSVSCLWFYYRCLIVVQKTTNFKRSEIYQSTALNYLYLSILLATCSFLAKQPGLIWSMALVTMVLFSLVSFNRIQSRFRLIATAQCGLLIFLMGAWFLLEGNTVHQNDGVLILSFEGRNWVEQFLHSVKTYFILKPFLFLLIFLAGIKAYKDIYFKKIYVLFLIPSLVLWFLFGAYQLRLGQHLIALAWLIVAVTPNSFVFLALDRQLKIINWFNQKKWKAAQVFMFLSVAISCLLWVKVAHYEQKGISFYQGGRLSLSRYFGEKSDWIYTNIYQQPDVSLWVPSRYIYGLFFNKNILYTPDYNEYEQYNLQALLDELNRKKPNYVFTVAPSVIDGPASGLLKDLITQNPDAFELVAGGPNRFNFMTYRFIPKNLNL